MFAVPKSAAGEERSMHAGVSLAAITPCAETRWLLENGPRELELLFRAIICRPSASILIADNDRNHQEASVGASRLLGVPREKIIGRRLDDFAAPGFKPEIADFWRSFLADGEHEGTLQLSGTDGSPRTVGYKARANVLPVRHVLLLHERTPGARKKP